MDRFDWYYRQQVTQAELDSFGDKIEQADWSTVKEILGNGFLIDVVYPATVEENAVPDFSVLAAAFLAYDQLGRRCSNLLSAFQGGVNLGPATPTQEVDLSVDEGGAGTNVTTPGNEKTISIFVEFSRNLTNPKLDGNAATVYFDQAESIKFNVVQSAEAPIGTSVAPPLRSDQLLLADVVREFGVASITNADISQARRQSFELSLIHGASHVETGSDPIPNATGAIGGLLSAVDKTKLDGITFTNAGVAALFQTFGSVFQPGNVVAPAATTLDVTAAFAGKTAGGDAANEGICTQSSNPQNRVLLTDENGDEFVDTSGGNNDSVEARVTVDNEGAPTTWTLSFYTVQAGVEVPFDMTPFAGQTIKWYVQEMFLLHNMPSFSPIFSVPSDQVAAQFPYPIKAEDSGASPINATGFSHLREGANITFADLGGGRLEISGPGAADPVPVGTVIMWYRPNTGTAVPTNYVLMQGQVIADGASPFNGLTIPDMQNRMPRGITAAQFASYPPAPTGGSDTHGHTASSDSQGSHSHSGGTGFAGTHNHSANTGSNGDHNHSISNDGSHRHGTAPGDPGGTIDTTAANYTDFAGDHNHGGSTGNNGNHSHTISSDGNHNHSINSDGSHSHNITVNSSSNLPAYVGLVFLLKIK